MAEQIPMKIIARICSDFPTKFGIPRQSGLISDLKSVIVFEPEYRNADALRGLEGFSHIWLVWQFSQAVRETWSPTVRPPRLGGNQRLGVFATRSPFRPNAIGLSSVKLEGIEHTQNHGTVIHVSGADLMDGTPIFDIKPYLPYSDCHPEATGGFAPTAAEAKLEIHFPDDLLALIPPEKQQGLITVLAHDPRPSYQNDPDRIYGFEFGGCHIKFRVENQHLFVLETETI